jgi:hypothetical protein
VYITVTERSEENNGLTIVVFLENSPLAESSLYTLSEGVRL